MENFDFNFWWSMEAMKYYSFTAAYKGNKQAKARELVMSEKYIGSRKMDGAWNMIIKDMNGIFHMRSRTAGVGGGVVDKAEWVPHIIKELNNIPNGTVLIGEIYFPDDEGSRKVTSVLNCLKDKCLDRQAKGKYLHYYVFDVLAYRGKSLIDTPIKERIETYLNYELFDVLKDNDYIEMANYVRGQALWDLYEETLAAGGEGIVITREDCTYLCGKKKAWMTLKMKQELADPVDAFLDGKYQMATRLYSGKEIATWSFWENPKTGEKFNTCKFDEYSTGASAVEPISKAYYYGWATRVSFSVMKDGQPYHIGWISGITDQLKEEIITKPEKWKGKVAELNAMQLEHIDGHYSFRHARIKQWRDDKAPEDCSFSQITDLFSLKAQS